MPRLKTLIGPVIGIVLLTVAVMILVHKFGQLNLRTVLWHVERIHTSRTLLAILLTMVYYTVITGYDVIAFRISKHPLEYSRIALASFVGYVLSHNVGMAAISNSSVRYRIHSSFGLSIKEVAKIVAYCTLTFWVGFLTVLSGMSLAFPIVIPHSLHLPFATTRLMGLVALAVLLTYIWLTTHTERVRSIGPINIPHVDLKTVALQMLVGSGDWLLGASIVYVLLPHSLGLTFGHFFGIFLLSQIAGLMSQVPAGLGIFETVMLTLLPAGASVPAVVGALIVYRVIYYLLPLIVAIILLISHEVRMGQVKN